MDWPEEVVVTQRDDEISLASTDASDSNMPKSAREAVHGLHGATTQSQETSLLDIGRVTPEPTDQQSKKWCF